MQLFQDIQHCEVILREAESQGKTIHEMTKLIADSSVHAFAKYFVYQYLIQAYPEDNHPARKAMRGLAKRHKKNKQKLHDEADTVLIQMRNRFMRLSSEHNPSFCQLLDAFAQFYAGTPAALDARSWSLQLQENRSWFSSSIALMTDICRIALNYAVDHPFQSAFIFLLALTTPAVAQQKNNGGKVVEVTNDHVANGQPVYLSTTDKEFNAVSDDEKALSELVDLKLRVDPTLDAKTADSIRRKCKATKPIVLKAIKQQHHDHITRVLMNPNFNGIYCHPSLIDKGTHYYGAFSPAIDAIVISVDATDESILGTITHEFIHGDSYYRHISSKCPQLKGGYATSPVYPDTHSAIDIWNGAFDRGDQRVREFDELLKKSVSNKILTQAEKKLLQTYKSAVNGIGMVEIISSSTLVSNYQHFSKGWQSKKAGTPLIVDYTSEDRGGTYRLELTSVSDFNNGFTYSLRATTYEQSLVLQLAETKLALTTSYKNHPPSRMLCEREAWTLQALTPLAADTFYSEAYVLRARDIKQCTESDDSIFAYRRKLNIGLLFAGSSRSINPAEAALAYQQASELANSEEHLAKAKSVFLRLTKLADWSDRAHLMLGHLAYRDKDYSTAVKHYDIAHEKTAISIDSPVRAADSYFQLGNLSKAMKVCEFGFIQLNVHKEEARLGLSELHPDAANQLKLLMELKGRITNRLNQQRKRV
jgi:tetratricopeptide (TPR) repeat protein